MEYFTKTICEDKWTFYLVDDDDNVIADEDAEAETDLEKQEVYFRREGVTLKTVKHEVWHIYMGYTYTDTANLDSLQTEEVSAQLYSNKDDKMRELSEEIYQKLVKLRDQEDT
jgi:hypothetical protein